MRQLAFNMTVHQEATSRARSGVRNAYSTTAKEQKETNTGTRGIFKKVIEISHPMVCTTYRKRTKKIRRYIEKRRKGAQERDIRMKTKTTKVLCADLHEDAETSGIQGQQKQNQRVSSKALR